MLLHKGQGGTAGGGSFMISSPDLCTYVESFFFFFLNAALKRGEAHFILPPAPSPHTGHYSNRIREKDPKPIVLLMTPQKIYV